MAAEFIGQGFDSKTSTIKDSPIKVLKLAKGPMSGTLDFAMELHSRQKTREIVIGASVSIGLPILGAKIQGHGTIRDDELNNYYSAEFCQEWKQTMEIKLWERSDLLVQNKWRPSHLDFKKCFGDKILWSTISGGKLCVTIIAKSKSKVEELNIDIDAKLRILFASVNVASYSSHNKDIDDNFEFSIYLDQKGGDKEALTRLLEEKHLAKWGTLEEVQQIWQAVFRYANEEFPNQTSELPYIYERKYINYTEPAIKNIAEF